ncbi:hypothetical protein CMMCAS08_15375 [Clavibacter michiganensis subsp. michiganensis]|uniref:Uncharacterized protein n=1 Tax=Clavibacter michiganensis subsp. michiganensis TaxID=33013 RepID=A0A251XMR3_CLAMM|nr:hypothetical protein BC477_07195 [Clavibacter michiganensis subsp. michiganensis]OUE00134.1 hypothetical protein CMMCAS06_00255 [Clavibacter michiganensis subsp. michiganensis]OUE02268.1 hypothetical protein CMMCAS08_15375 [Clavibacter michiganensis subsp. michiganensis]OUE04503.1 hypothetical protein CMMCAS07_06125 [Clavibacter michiganensis subsp. michiganensis]
MGRYTAMRRASQRPSQGEKSRRLGISRQKGSELVNKTDVTEQCEMALSYLARTIPAER